MRRPVLVGVVLGLGLLVLVDALASRLGLAAGVWPRFEGLSAWTASRAAGVTAYVALTMDVVFGLFVSTGAADRWLPRARSVDAHRWLSSAALALTAVHALTLTLDRLFRFDVLDAIVPFLSSYRSFAVGLGVLAAYGALVVHLSFDWRKRIGGRTWRRLHRLSFGVFAAALVHGLLAGSDTGRPGLLAIYVASGLAVAGLGALRALRALRPAPRR